MKKKKIDNNSKFLFMMSGFFVLLFAMIFVSTEFGKVTYSAENEGGGTCSGVTISGYCCTGNKETNYIGVSYYDSPENAFAACQTLKQTTVGVNNICTVHTKTTGLYKYNNNYYTDLSVINNICIAEGDSACNYHEETGYFYSIKNDDGFYWMTNCQILPTNDLSLTSTSITFRYGLDASKTLTASGGSGQYNFRAHNCTGFTIETNGTISINSSTYARDNTYSCSVTVTDKVNGTSIIGTVNIKVQGYNYCKINSQHEYQWYTNQKYSTDTSIVNKTQSDCKGCEAGYYRNEGVCTPCTKCDGGACTCDNSKNEKYTREFALQQAATCAGGTGTVEPSQYEGCYKVTCPPVQNTCVATNKEYQTAAERDTAASADTKCTNVVNKWQASNGCYKYACKDAPADPSSGSSSSSSSSSVRPSSSSVKSSSKSSNITVNPPTGPGLIIIVSMLSVIMVAYSVWYFKKNQE